MESVLLWPLVDCCGGKYTLSAKKGQVETKIVCVVAVVNLSEQTHLSEVVISLLQSGELPQETLILCPLLIQLSLQS